MSTLPFRLSSGANAWLSKLPDKAGEELGFVCSPRYGMSRGSEIIESFEREHYAFVHARPDVWTEGRAASRFTIGDRAFWLTAENFDSLAGKTLEVVRVDVGQGQHWGRFREFLIASTHEEWANKMLR